MSWEEAASDDEDFEALFDDFNSVSALANLAEQISSNLRTQVGLDAGAAVHEGEADEGMLTWTAPLESGLQNSSLASEFKRSEAEEVENELWAELVEESDGQGKDGLVQMSANLKEEWASKTADASMAIRTMDDDEAMEAADIFDRLAAHGTGHVVLDVQEFQSLLLKLAEDEKGCKLLRLLLQKQKEASAVRSASRNATPKPTRRAEVLGRQ